MARSNVVVALLLTASLAAPAYADVKTEQRTLVQFEGMMGRMMRMVGGKAAKDGVLTNVALQGDRMARLTGETGEIVDLAEEKVYQLDLKKKTYRVLTFDQMRQQYEAAMQMVEQQAQPLKQAQGQETPQEPPRQTEIDVAINETGQRKTISGYDCREIVSTVTTRQKGKTLEEAGGMVVTTSMWMAPAVPAMTELASFERRYAQRLLGSEATTRAQEMMTALAMYPGLQEAMKRASEEAAKLQGTAMLTVAKVESVMGAEEAAARQKAGDESEDEEMPTSLGGLLGKKMTKKSKEPAPQGASNRTLVMTSTTELTKIADAVAPGDLAIPAGFRERGQAQ